jgi:hypothetical protein
MAAAIHIRSWSQRSSVLENLATRNARPRGADNIYSSAVLLEMLVLSMLTTLPAVGSQKNPSPPRPASRWGGDLV